MNCTKILSTLIFLLTALFVSNDAIANNSTNLSSPRKTMRYFINTMKEYKQGDKAAIKKALTTLDLTELDHTSRVYSGKLAAERLIKTIDKIEKINTSKIPTNPKNDIWIFRKKTVFHNGISRAVEISIYKNDQQNWLFTKKTVSSIEFFEKSLKNISTIKGVQELSSWTGTVSDLMPDWTGQKFFILMTGQWIAILFLILMAYIAERIIRKYLVTKTGKLIKKYGLDNSDEREKKLRLPVGIMIISGIWSLGIRGLELPDDILSTFLRMGLVAFTVSTVMTVHRIVDVVSLYFEKLALESENKFDDILVPLMRKTIKCFVVAVGIIFIGDSLTIDMKSILAGLGIGGLAFALAAKDTISNVFGSITVLLDRPFHIGDWISIGNNIEGIVEEVGLRSTRIRTFYDSLITVPNGQLTNVHIDNFGKRKYRRFKTVIGVQYDTPPEKIEAFCEGIRQIILKHKWTRKDYFHVYFNGFGDFSLNILIYVFWHVPDWSAELSEKHRLLVDVLRLGNEMKIEFAFPTQTLHMFQENKLPETFVPDRLEAHEFGNKLATGITEKPISMSESRSGTKTGSFKNNKVSL